MLRNSDLSGKEHLFLGKLYSSRRTSAFGNLLVRDTRVLVLDGRTSGSFLPWSPAFSVGFQVEVGPVKVDVADTESLQTRSVCERLGGPCLLGGSGGMPPRKF